MGIAINDIAQVEKYIFLYFWIEIVLNFFFNLARVFSFSHVHVPQLDDPSIKTLTVMGP
jgi:hypothetical protein